jgi:hypothetical protein
MTVREYLKQLIQEALPTASGLAANGRNLEKFRKDAEVDDDEVQWMLSYHGFDRKEQYDAESGERLTTPSDPIDVLAFRLLIRMPDDEALDADGYEQVTAVLEALRANSLFQLDDGFKYEIDVPGGSAMAEDKYANDVFEILILVG